MVFPYLILRLIQLILLACKLVLGIFLLVVVVGIFLLACMSAVQFFHSIRIARRRRRRRLKLKAGACSLPKQYPDERRPKGQDAYFICQRKRTIGVADGIGGYPEIIDSGVYARRLMKNACDFVKDEYGGVNPMAILNRAYEKTRGVGASTACIITLEDDYSLNAVNIGDSGFCVIRSGKIVYRSPIQQSKFNCPFSLEPGGKISPIRDGMRIRFEVEIGDVIVAATDGLFDNLFNLEIEKSVSESLEEDEDPEDAACKLGELARSMSLDCNYKSPWTLAAIKDGRDINQYLGGKYDDVTIIIGYLY